jgi:hypothetical protein
MLVLRDAQRDRLGLNGDPFSLRGADNTEAHRAVIELADFAVEETDQLRKPPKD